MIRQTARKVTDESSALNDVNETDDETDEEASDDSGSDRMPRNAGKYRPKVRYDAEALESNAISMAVCSIVCDVRNYEVLPDTKDKGRHLLRCTWTMIIVFFVLGLQMYITVMVKALVTPFTVEQIRDLYDSYEQTVYANTTIKQDEVEGRKIHSHYRGVDGTFDISKFESMSTQDRRDICQISLTQPFFVFVILMLWSLTCVHYIRQNFQLTYRLVCATRTIDDMANALGPSVEDHVAEPKTVRGLTCGVKTLLVLGIQMPQFLMITYLMWLGSRWLLATIGFGDLVLNAIALEFVLNLHELVYKAIVPLTMALEVGATAIPHARTRRPERLGCTNMFSAFALLLLCIAWSLVYMFLFQNVLPGYKWDVKQACDLHEPKSFHFFI
jgi:hypothetical protein